jgi:hypothetical protein
MPDISPPVPSLLVSARRAPFRWEAKDCVVVPKESLPLNTLGPDDLRMAADAFEAALRALDEATCPYNPHTVRLIIGRYIIERALAGERDPAKLGHGALMCLETVGKANLASLKEPIASLH